MLPIVVEVQSELHHASLVDAADDTRRRDQLDRDGFVVVEVWDHEVWHQPSLVAERIRAARSALLLSSRLVSSPQTRSCDAEETDLSPPRRRFGVRSGGCR